MKKYWLKILMLSSLALMIVLAPASTQQSKLESTPESPQALPLYTEAQLQAAIKAAAQAAVDKAVPLAVQAAVAQKESELAVEKVIRQDAEAERGRWELKAALWRGVGIAAVGGCVGIAADRSTPRGALYGAGTGLIAGVVWWLSDKWPLKIKLP